MAARRPRTARQGRRQISPPLLWRRLQQRWRTEWAQVSRLLSRTTWT